MRSRPWPIVIIALFHIFAPLGNGLLHCLLRNISLTHYFQLLLHSARPGDLFGEFILLPMAGLSLLMFRRWSYLAFSLAATWAIYRTLESWYVYPNIASPVALLAIVIFNLTVIGYFTLPTVRAVYFDRSLRWWESKPRFALELETKIFPEDNKKPLLGKIINISEGGVFLATDSEIPLENAVCLNFIWSDQEFSLEGTLVRKMSAPIVGYGLQFSNTRAIKKDAKRLMKAVREQGLEPRNGQTPKLKSFTLWIKELATTGKGILPELPADYGKRALERSPQADRQAG